MREILEIDDVAEYREHDLMKGKSICERQQDVYRNYYLTVMLIPSGRCEGWTRT